MSSVAATMRGRPRIMAVVTLLFGKVEGVAKVLRALEAGKQKRFLHYYAPRTGKTFVQAALAFWLMKLRKELGFSLVVIINDREFLDTQSYEAVLSFLENVKQAGNPWRLEDSVRIVQAETSSELKQELALCEQRLAQQIDCPTILFTTFQKFNTLELIRTQASMELAAKTLVMPDEVHRSHQELGSLTLSMERALGASYFVALTGTPNTQALERFGTLGSDGFRRPFHSYHLGQAVSDGLVMDPRTEYSEVVSIISGLDDSSITEKEKARLQTLMASSSGTAVRKARVELVLKHFVSTCGSLSYRAQGIVLCSSREEVLHATRLARSLVREQPHLDIARDDILGAFSGRVDGETEKDLNGHYLKSAAEAKQARILFVAHKFETGYDNSNVTCMYVFRKIEAGTLAAQVLLRHCSKRAGKIRPVTIDFANQDGQLLQAMAMYFGEVMASPGGGLVAASARRPGRDQRGGHEASSSRRAIEQHLLGRIQLERLEVKTRPVATPLRISASTTLGLSAAREGRPRQVSEVVPTDNQTDLMLLKVLPAGHDFGEHEKAALARLHAKAITGHASTLKALSNGSAVVAMKKVLTNGTRPHHEKAKAILQELQKVDGEAKKVCNLLDCLQSMASKPPQECLDAARSLQTLVAEEGLLEVAAKQGACDISLQALTKFDSWSLTFSFHGFDSPFFAGRNAAFFQEIWRLLAQLGQTDSAAAGAVTARRHLKALGSFTGSNARTSSQLQGLADLAKGELLLKALHKDGALESLTRVLEHGDLDEVKLAENILERFEDISDDAFRLGHTRFFMSQLLTQATFDSTDRGVIDGLCQRGLPQQAAFGSFFHAPRISAEGHRSVEVQAVQALSLTDTPPAKRRLFPAWCCYALALAAQLSAAGGAEERITPAMAVRDLPTLTNFLEEYEANVVDGTGQTVLHWAASAGKPEAIDYTLDQGALVDKLDRDGRSPLHIAALSGHTEAVQLLLARRADPAVGDGSGATPLHRAALAGAAGCVAVLAQSAPGQLDVAQRRTGGTALHAAAYLGHVNVIEELLRAGASPCSRDHQGRLPLDRWVEEDHDEVAKIAEEPPVVDDANRKAVVSLLWTASRACKSGTTEAHGFREL
ncbi:ANKK1 [Symbiodinium sp. CCMP2592]|nr:ANKK1 [Symbiodinium sp. CCMP2592]